MIRKLSHQTIPQHLKTHLLGSTTGIDSHRLRCSDRKPVGARIRHRIIKCKSRTRITGNAFLEFLEATSIN